MKVAKGLFYTEDHEWVKVDGEEALVGIADYAQDALGDIVYAELPEVDDEFDKEEAFFSCRISKGSSRYLYASRWKGYRGKRRYTR